MTKCDCVLHNDVDTVCDDQATVDGSDYYCCLPAGHRGDHQACAPGAHPLHTWEDTDE